MLYKEIFLYSVPHKNKKFNWLAERRSVELKSGGIWSEHRALDGEMSVI